MTAPTASSEEKNPAPVVDLERIEQTYDELKRMQVALDPNPIEYGPKRFNNRIAQVRALLNRIDQMFLQISEDLHYFQREINGRRTLYELEKRELLVNDPRCRVGRSQQEREALADVQLRDQIEKVQKLEGLALDLETLMVSVKSKRTDLKNVQSRMRDQMKLIEHDIGMGARWGMNATPSPHSENVQEIDDLLVSVDDKMGWSDEMTPAQSTGNEEDEDEEDEEDEEEGEEGEQEAANQDPAPEASPVSEEPVIEFGTSEPEEDADIASLIPSDAEDADLLPDDNAQEDADAFLSNLDPDAENEEPQDQPPEALGSDGIDDLIASFAED